MFALRVWMLPGRYSTKSQVEAPREIASRPRAPVPAKRSRIRALARCGARWSRMAPRTCSAVGRIRASATSARCRPASLPAMMRTRSVPPEDRDLLDDVPLQDRVDRVHPLDHLAEDGVVG